MKDVCTWLLLQRNFSQRITLHIAFVVVISVIHYWFGLADFPDCVHRCIVALRLGMIMKLLKFDTQTYLTQDGATAM